MAASFCMYTLHTEKKAGQEIKNNIENYSESQYKGVGLLLFLEWGYCALDFLLVLGAKKIRKKHAVLLGKTFPSKTKKLLP